MGHHSVSRDLSGSNKERTLRITTEEI